MPYAGTPGATHNSFWITPLPMIGSWSGPDDDSIRGWCSCNYRCTTYVRACTGSKFECLFHRLYSLLHVLANHIRLIALRSVFSAFWALRVKSVWVKTAYLCIASSLLSQHCKMHNAPMITWLSIYSNPFYCSDAGWDDLKTRSVTQYWIKS